MAIEDALKSLREFDIGDVDLDNVGAWPVLVKVIICIGLLIAVLVGGYYYHVQNLQVQLSKVQKAEEQLKQDFEGKAFQAANLDAYRQQMIEMEESFGALVSQLPSDTVTLHDFNIEARSGNANDLSMNIVAKTYRYKNEEPE